MNKNKYIPQGYKESPLGIIPKEWEVKRLGEVCTFLDSQRIPIKDADRGKMQGEYPYYGASGIIDYVNDYIFDDDLILLGEDGANILLRNTPLAFLVSGKVWVNNHAHVLKTKQGFDRYYVCNYLETLSYDKYNTGTAQPKLNREICEKIPILLPPKEEQNRISKLLVEWDTAIEKQSELIEKLKLRKRALMQQLLTGKKRLPGFNGEWKKVKLGSIAEIVGGGTPNTNISHYWNGGIPWFTPTEIGKTKYVSESKKTISAHGQNNSSAKILPKGTILFTSRATIGAKAILTVEATTNQGFQSLIVHNNNNNEFIYYYLDIILKNIKQKASGSTFTEISAESMRRTEIIIPPKEEQNAIVSIFVNADKEIELANEKLASLQSQKRGLMQQLLTGKKRI